MVGRDGCPFCEFANGRFDGVRQVTAKGAWLTFTPIGPVNSGHALIAPKRHVQGLHDLLDDEAVQLPFILRQARLRYGALDYNLGVNFGEVAGQSVEHLHIHLIPRTAGDVDDPKGGIITPLAALFKESKFDEYLAGRCVQ